jgi:hypothetical protein
VRCFLTTAVKECISDPRCKDGKPLSKFNRKCTDLKNYHSQNAKKDKIVTATFTVTQIFTISEFAPAPAAPTAQAAPTQVDSNVDNSSNVNNDDDSSEIHLCPSHLSLSIN